jgi:DNA-binding transcriptional regulator YiaG
MVIKDTSLFRAGANFPLDIHTTKWYIDLNTEKEQIDPMKSEELIKIRQEMGKTQKELAILLGTSNKAIQSYEQGWRPVPNHVERHLYFLLVLKKIKTIQPCWDIKNCPDEKRKRCPAWELQTGHLCWFINGTVCDGEIQKNWKTKMETCKKCEVFTPILSK